MTSDRRDIEERLRQLGTHLDEERGHRGSIGVPGSGSAALRRKTRRKPLSPGLLLAAAAAVVIVAGLALVIGPDDSSDSIDAALRNEGELSDQDESSSSSSSSSPSLPGSSEGDGQPTGEVSLPTVLASLSAGVDPVAGPLVFIGGFDDGPRQVALDYLSQRMPDLSPEVVELETTPADQLLGPTNSDVLLTLVRWRYQEPDGPISGSLVIRSGFPRPGVVAAIADAVDVVEVDRSLERIRVVVTNRANDLLLADVTTIDGAVVAGAPFPDGLDDGVEPAIGTAGSTDAERLEIDFELESTPVIVRLQHLGGTWLSVTEFGVASAGFDAPCGSIPPVSIEVGEHLGDLRDGAAPRSQRPALINQSVWHHAGDLAEIEIRWPADPVLTSRLADGEPTSDLLLGFSPPVEGAYDASLPEESMQHLVGRLEWRGADRCSLVEISLYGRSSVVGWWSTALSGAWSFGLPLSVADLDPVLGPLGLDPEQEAASGEGELVIGSAEVAALPAVAETGSCDGLPDAPPDRGPGSKGQAHDEAVSALDDFVSSGPRADPPLPTDGYTELIRGGEVIGYVHGSVDDPLVVVTLTRSGNDWRVDGWSAAPC